MGSWVPACLLVVFPKRSIHIHAPAMSLDEHPFFVTLPRTGLGTGIASLSRVFVEKLLHRFHYLFSILDVQDAWAARVDFGRCFSLEVGSKYEGDVDFVITEGLALINPCYRLVG